MQLYRSISILAWQMGILICQAKLNDASCAGVDADLRPTDPFSRDVFDAIAKHGR
jgi:hypothetical protein